MASPSEHDGAAAAGDGPQVAVGAPPTEIQELHEINPNLQICQLKDGTYATITEGKRTPITMIVYESLLTSIASPPKHPAPSDSNWTGVTGLKAPSDGMTDREPIEWGDMDPNYVKELRSDPIKYRMFRLHTAVNSPV